MQPFNPKGGGEVFRISSDGDDRIGAKIKTQKSPWTKNQPPKNPMPNFQALRLFNILKSTEIEFTMMDILNMKNSFSGP